MIPWCSELHALPMGLNPAWLKTNTIGEGAKGKATHENQLSQIKIVACMGFLQSWSNQVRYAGVERL